MMYGGAHLIRFLVFFSVLLWRLFKSLLCIHSLSVIVLTPFVQVLWRNAIIRVSSCCGGEKKKKMSRSNLDTIIS